MPVDVSRIADRYIARDGSEPLAQASPALPETPGLPADAVTIPASEYRRLLLAAESDEMIVWCEVCGAWIDRDEPAYCSAEDFTGCWKAATGDGPCVSHRATR